MIEFLKNVFLYLLELMKNILFILALVPVLASAQTAPLRTYTLRDGSFYVKEKSNLMNTMQFETGVSSPLVSSGNLSLSANFAYVLDFSNPWNQNSWTGGMTFGYRLNDTYSAYTKTASNFNGRYSQETGVRASLYRTMNYAVNANAGYVMDRPFNLNRSARWTVGVTVSFPVSSFVK